MINPNNINKIYPLLQSNSFPFLEKTFDDMDEYAILARLQKKLNEVIGFINTTLEKSINEYINEKFNDMMLNAMYEAETETLILYLDRKE